jgi:RNA polymerase sigma-70 factor (ECF subfamily)
LSSAEGFAERRRARFSRILEKYRAPVISFLYRLIEDQAAAEALAQQVFLRAYGSLAVRAQRTSCETWLFRTAMQLALRDGRGAGAMECVEADSLDVLVRRAMSALPVMQRAAMLLRKYEGFDYSQIGTVLGCSDSAARLLLLRAHETLCAQTACAKLHGVAADHDSTTAC